MKAYPRAIHWRASVSLTVAAALLIETACSGTPPPPAPQLTSSPSEIRSRLVLYARDNAVIRLHLDDGTVIPTGHYLLTDSTVVVDDVLHGRDYMPELNVAHLFSKQHTKELPDSVALPMNVPLDRIVALQSWNFPLRPNATGEEVAPRIAVYASEKAIARLHTVDGTVIPTSHYTVVDSVIVISDVLRGDKYFPEENQPRVHGIPSPSVKTLPPDMHLPLTIPVAQVSTVDQWQDPHSGRNGIVPALLIFGAAGLVLAALLSTHWDFMGGDWSGDGWTFQ